MQISEFCAVNGFPGVEHFMPWQEVASIFGGLIGLVVAVGGVIFAVRRYT